MEFFFTYLFLGAVVASLLVVFGGVDSGLEFTSIVVLWPFVVILILAFYVRELWKTRLK